MWIRIKEPIWQSDFLRRVRTNAFAGARIHLTSLIVILQKRPQSLKENNSGGFCVIAHSPNTAKFDVQDESELLFSSSFFRRIGKTNLELFEAGPVQMPPTVPRSAFSFSSASFRPSSSLAMKGSAAVRTPPGWMRRISPFGWLFLAKAVIFCCQGATSSLEQFAGSSHLCPMGQWGLSCSRITRRGPMACLPKSGSSYKFKPSSSLPEWRIKKNKDVKE